MLHDNDNTERPSRQSTVPGQVLDPENLYSDKRASYLVLLAGQCLAVRKGVESLMDTSLTRLLTMVQVGNVNGFRIVPPLQDSLIESCPT